MPSFRIGYGSDFSIDSNGVGIGTSFAASNTKLDVVGALKGDFNITGVTTLTAYGGFVAQQQHVNKASTIGFATVGLQTFAGLGTVSQYYETDTGFTDLGGVHHGDDQRFNTLSEDLVIDDGQILNITNTDMVGVTTIGEYDPHTHASYVCAGSLEQVSVTGHFSVPNGGSNDRQLSPIEGTVRFNDDLNTLEFFNGNEWRQFTYNQGQSGGSRAVFMGGEAPSPTYALSGKNISYANISSLGNSNNFGDLSLNGKYGGSGMSNSTRGVIAGGWNSSPGPGNQYDIEYITIASEGNAIDWGENNTGGWGSTGSSSSTRGLSAGGGYPSASVTIDSILFSTVGTKEDWGDITAYKGRGTTSCNDPTRSVFFGGYTPALQSTIEYKTTASDSNTVFFGDLITTTRLMPGMSSSTRGVMGTQDYQANDFAMGYITIATTGNAQYFGDLTVARSWAGATANQVRGLYVGGRQSGTYYNTIDYCTISTAGNFVDFGDLTGGNNMQKACVSDSHGGLGGF
jgi:hypothetical protein